MIKHRQMTAIRKVISIILQSTKNENKQIESVVTSATKHLRRLGTGEGSDGLWLTCAVHIDYVSRGKHAAALCHHQQHALH